jgi:hypothetical protein
MASLQELLSAGNRSITSTVLVCDGRKGKREMNMARLLIAIAFLGTLAGVAAISFSLGEGNAVGALSVRQVTADQLGAAMQADQFYSEYREATLLVRGSVASVYADGHGFALEFKTQNGFKTICQLGQYPSAVNDGDTLTAVTEGANAERLSSAVLLSNCVLLARR